MSAKDEGVVALVSMAVENGGGSKLLVLHRIIHQQSLRGKCLDMCEVLKPVISTVILSDLLDRITENSDNLLKRLEKMTYLIILPYVGLVVGKSFSAFLNFDQ
nr:unnamed protein product [Callosobruchus analis]